MSIIEKEYRRAVARYSGQQRVARSAALFEELRSMLAHKLKTEDPSIDDRRLRLEVAASMYRTDPETQRLLSLLDA